MKRKVIKLGPSTLVVSIPSKWSRDNHINAGQEIELTQTDNGLLLQSGKKQKEVKQITVNITEKNRHNLYNILTHIYRKGFDKIRINGQDLSHAVKKITEETLLGFELTARAKDYCIIENIAEPSEEKFATMLRRIYLVIKESHEKLAESFSENRFQGNEIEDLRNQNDKFVIFCRRIVHKEFKKDSIIYWELLTHLSKIQHVYYYLYKYVEKNGFEKDKEIMPLLQELKEYFNLSYQAYYTRNLGLIHKMQKQKDDYQFGKCLDLINRNKNQVIFSYIRELFRVIQLGTSPLLSLFEEY
ncbi:MAG: AbrB/MazE/SpoVT family DNA-binding domain-containing protein [Candidatus Woesearchaeota archaeon]